MTDADQLVAWLREAMDGAERAASKAAELCGCHPPAPSWTCGDETTDGRIAVVDDPHPGLKRKIGRRWNGSYEGMAMAEHIVRHDPEAVLRRISADRKILELHRNDGGNCAVCADPLESSDDSEGNREWSRSAQYFPCTTVRNLAEGYGWTEEATP